MLVRVYYYLHAHANLYGSTIKILYSYRYSILIETRKLLYYICKAMRFVKAMPSLPTRYLIKICGPLSSYQTRRQ